VTTLGEHQTEPAIRQRRAFPVNLTVSKRNFRVVRDSGSIGHLFGLEVRRQCFNLSEFDRVSLSRAAFVPATGFPSSVETRS